MHTDLLNRRFFKLFSTNLSMSPAHTNERCREELSHKYFNVAELIPCHSPDDKPSPDILVKVLVPLDSTHGNALDELVEAMGAVSNGDITSKVYRVDNDNNLVIAEQVCRYVRATYELYSTLVDKLPEQITERAHELKVE